MNRLYDFCGGRSTTFAWIFTIAGVIGFFCHLLSGGQFVALDGMVHGFVIVRAIGEDKYCKDSCNDPDKSDDDKSDDKPDDK